MTRWVVDELGPDVPLHFTAFHPDFKMLDVPATPPADAHPGPRASPWPNGLRYVYTGNVHDREGDTTVCPGCGDGGRRARLVRDGELEARPTTATAGRAAPRVAGVFDGPPGEWGRHQRVPVELKSGKARRR